MFPGFIRQRRHAQLSELLFRFCFCGLVASGDFRLHLLRFLSQSQLPETRHVRADIDCVLCFFF
jgi:hypothetical protein